MNTQIPLEPGQTASHQDPISKKWISGIIWEKCKELNSYTVEADTGATHPRNRNFLKATQVVSTTEHEQNYISTPGWPDNSSILPPEASASNPVTVPHTL